eukprot:gene17057-24640_t
MALAAGWAQHKAKFTTLPQGGAFAKAGGKVSADTPFLKEILPGTQIVEAKMAKAQRMTKVCGRTGVQALWIRTKGRSARGAALGVQVLQIAPEKSPVRVAYGLGDIFTRCSRIAVEAPAAKADRELRKLREGLVELEGGIVQVDRERNMWRRTEAKEKREEREEERVQKREERKARKKEDKEERRRRPPKRYLRIIQWNGQGIRAHQHEVRRMLSEHAPHVLLFEETMLRKDNADPRFAGYDLLRRDRQREGVDQGGGLAALFVEGLSWCETRGGGD